jgi:hypothetical protein
MRITDLSGLPIPFGEKPALAIVAIPATNAAPNINDRTIVFLILFSRPSPE